MGFMLNGENDTRPQIPLKLHVQTMNTLAVGVVSNISMTRFN